MLSKDYERILQSAQSKGIDPSLEPVRAMLHELGDPDLSFEAIQIVGTNGKTSTARHLASILVGEGFRVGLYLSPMFMTYLDQIEVEGKPIAEVELDQAVRDAWNAGKSANAVREEQGLRALPLTEFDLLTVAAVLVFQRRGVEIAVLEAGMGGEWDATSAVRSIKTVGITGVALDHTRILGSTLEQIASNKAAVIQHGRQCVLGAQTQEHPEVAEVLRKRCSEQGVVPIIVKGGYSPSLASGKSPYQAPNIACAIALAEAHVGRVLNEDALGESIRKCRTPGRFDILQEEPLILVDACHNPQSVQAFLDAWHAVYPNKSAATTLLCAIFADKDVERMVDMLAKEFDHVVVTQTSSRRAMQAEQLARVFKAHGVVPEATFACVQDAVAYLRRRPFVACGSITTAGEVAMCVG